MLGIVDRKESNYYVIEMNGITKDVPKNQVASGVREGDVVELKNGIWMKNDAATKQRANSIAKLMKDVWED
ncbi:DUF3006 domain-containing protein [Paenibacillus albiflavus]|uniref:DUF3006 domain-containing protein n=1 Tax=Paenibacillus albiflavus TaxID=2545760 RepID=A0A4R4EKF3_9BACL|nr:DUF3006 domain-containing protein [Paenibacillus albiflavus]TCZ79943.1 DUF3006 domain-containing protein [Paenibacillus albiflavus]